jgi:hypothetical protein
MSKSGNYNLSEIERRDALIQELTKALETLLDDYSANGLQGKAGLIACEVIAKVREGL